jgi:putative tricarboxylic transport membrane protein
VTTHFLANRADVLLGAGAVGMAACYLVLAGQIPESMLADEVGAAGVPRALGWIMVALGALIAVRGLLMPGAKPFVEPGTGEGSAAWHAHALALGLLALIVAYLAITPYAGFGLAIALLIGSVASYAGARFDRTLVITSVLAGLGFWIAFAHVLGINMPVSILLEGR